jgi:hypothetical protein
MTQKMQLYLLIGLIAVLALVWVYNWNKSPANVVASTGAQNFEPLSVENPSLRLDKLERIRKLEYQGSRRSIFTAQLPPPPAPPGGVAKIPTGPPPPPPEQPLTLPVKFFGYAVDPHSGRKRAFFTNGEDVFILSEGELLQNRFRLLRIGNNAADFEEVPSGKRASLPLEQPGT